MKRYIIIYSNGSVLDSYPLLSDTYTEKDYLDLLAKDKDVSKVLNHHGDEVYVKEP